MRSLNYKQNGINKIEIRSEFTEISPGHSFWPRGSIWGQSDATRSIFDRFSIRWRHFDRNFDGLIMTISVCQKCPLPCILVIPCTKDHIRGNWFSWKNWPLGNTCGMTTMILWNYITVWCNTPDGPIHPPHTQGPDPVSKPVVLSIFPNWKCNNSAPPPKSQGSPSDIKVMR